MKKKLRSFRNRGNLFPFNGFVNMNDNYSSGSRIFYKQAFALIIALKKWIHLKYRWSTSPIPKIFQQIWIQRRLRQQRLVCKTVFKTCYKAAEPSQQVDRRRQTVRRQLPFHSGHRNLSRKSDGFIRLFLVHTHTRMYISKHNCNTNNRAEPNNKTGKIWGNLCSLCPAVDVR